jgi:D-methionine transport system ATP-binding protein
MHDILKQVSFHVNRGDRLSLLGPSGSGKTSLLRLTNRLSEPSHGAIFLDGQNIQQIPIARLRSQVPFVLQESKLLGMTVRDALMYPLQLRKLDAATIRARLEKWASALAIPQDWLDRTEMQLSVGQRQLVAIARALMIEPSILLLDEPTSALDIGRSEALIQLFHQLSHSEAMTIIMANHDLALAEQFCTHVVVMENGTVRLHASSTGADWQQIKTTISASELQAAHEWGDD